MPRNPLIADPLYLAHYIEKAGSGTLDMIALCREAGLPEPDFRQDGGQFVMTLWRDWLTPSLMDSLGLDERERKLLALIKVNGRIANQMYQDAFDVSKATASRHLEALVDKGFIERVGTTGKGTYYSLRKKGLTKGSLGSDQGKGS
jgi:ATP-dependent DNA helicase RecG